MPQNIESEWEVVWMVDGCRVKEQSGGGIERECEAGSEKALPFYACFPFVIVTLHRLGCAEDSRWKR